MSFGLNELLLLYNKFGKLSHQTFMPTLICACMKYVNHDVMQLVTCHENTHVKCLYKVGKALAFE